MSKFLSMQSKAVDLVQLVNNTRMKMSESDVVAPVHWTPPSKAAERACDTESELKVVMRKRIRVKTSVGSGSVVEDDMDVHSESEKTEMPSLESPRLIVVGDASMPSPIDDALAETITIDDALAETITIEPVDSSRVPTDSCHKSEPGPSISIGAEPGSSIANGGEAEQHALLLSEYENLLKTVGIETRPPMTIKHVKGDGNCLFRGLAFLEGDEGTHDALRCAVVAEVQTNPDAYNEFLHRPLEEWCSDMLAGAWGDGICLAAASNVLESPIVVFRKNSVQDPSVFIPQIQSFQSFQSFQSH